MQELHVKSLLPVRLDKYLMEQFPALGLGRLNKALRENKIKLNGKKQPLATRVQNGDVIRVYLLDDQLGLTSQEGPEFLQARAPAEFIYENDDLIVANKPAGIPVDGDEADTLLRERKLGALGEAFADAPPAAILSANMGCITHLQGGTDIPVRHWVELLDEALLA